MWKMLLIYSLPDPSPIEIQYHHYTLYLQLLLVINIRDSLYQETADYLLDIFCYLYTSWQYYYLPVFPGCGVVLWSYFYWPCTLVLFYMWSNSRAAWLQVLSMFGSRKKIMMKVDSHQYCSVLNWDILIYYVVCVVMSIFLWRMITLNFYPSVLAMNIVGIIGNKNHCSKWKNSVGLLTSACVVSSCCYSGII